MFDLSWLNPTPRAIAVYASQPPSPVATQHSLPSGRCPLLGPDFHRLDRTSFCLAHSLDHLVSTQQERFRDREANRLGGLEVIRWTVGLGTAELEWTLAGSPKHTLLLFSESHGRTHEIALTELDPAMAQDVIRCCAEKIEIW